MLEYIKQYNKLGDRIRSCRKEKGLSQTDFISMLKDKGCGIGRNTLSDFENGEQNKITLPQLLAMCDCLDVSLGHILGEYTAKTYDHQFIQDVTGLSETAIDKLKALKIQYPFANSILALIVSHPDFVFLAYSIYEFLKSKEEQITVLQTLNDVLNDDISPNNFDQIPQDYKTQLRNIITSSNARAYAIQTYLSSIIKDIDVEVNVNVL